MPAVKRMFEKVRLEYYATIYRVVTTVGKKNGFETTKSYLGTLDSDMKTDLKDVKEVDGLAPIVRMYCLFPSVQLLENLVETFAEELAERLTEVKELLAKFEKGRKELYEQVLIKDFVKEVKQKALLAKVILFR